MKRTMRAASLAAALLIGRDAFAAPRPPAVNAAAKPGTVKKRSRKKYIAIAAVTGAVVIGAALASKRLNNEGFFSRF